MKQITLIACMVLTGYGLIQYGTMQAMDHRDQTSFMYAINRTQTAPLVLSQIEKAIVAHMFRRKMDNWIFTSTRVHSATLQAIHAYETLTDEDRSAAADQMQMVLNSHANLLYNPFCWNKRKHIALVDGFIYSTTGKRLELSALDDIPTRISGGVTAVPVIVTRTNHTSNQK